MAVLEAVGSVFRKVFGSRNERIVKKFGQIAEQITALEPQLRGDFDAQFLAAAVAVSADLPPEEREKELQRIRVGLSTDLLERTASLRERIANGEPIESTLAEAFATLREGLAQGTQPSPLRLPARRRPGSLQRHHRRNENRRRQDHRLPPCRISKGA
ncbi:MAG: hypothetical protein IPK83_00825 [Planctomycetes bacterium]|nr:hypothetical protein [Planctomycetota bacterium]